MLNKKGLTLIEVVVSIALIGLIAVAFLPPLSNYFKWIVDTKTNITKTAFDSQEDLEKNINIVKELLNDHEFSGDIDPDDFDLLRISKKISQIKLFETKYSKVSYPNRKYPNAYQVESSLSPNRKFTTLIGDKRLPELVVPEIVVESIHFLKENTQSSGKFEYFNYPNKDKPNLKINAISNMFKNPQNSFNRYRHDWYVSNPGFLIPVPDVEFIDEDFDMGRIYPSFPDDFISTPIVSELGNTYSYVSMDKRTIEGTLTNSHIFKETARAGRHIIYTITPFAKSLKMGKTSTILPLYLYGPNDTENLEVHLDASVINIGDIYNDSTNATGSLELDGDDRFHLRTWKNTRPHLKAPNTNRNAKQYDTDYMPILIESDVFGTITPEISFQEESTNFPVWGRSLGNKDNIDNDMASMEISNISLNNNFSIFMIMRKVSSPISSEEGPILSGNGWSLGWTKSLDLAFKIDEDDTRVLLKPLNTIDPDNSGKTNWYLVKLYNDNGKINLQACNLKFGIDQNIESRPNDVLSSLNTTKNITINWNGVEISEILIYTEYKGINSEVEKYLKGKYNPEGNK